MKQKISFFATLLLATVFVLGSCSEEKGNFPGEGSVKLRLSLASISAASESDTRNALAAPKTEKFYYTNPDDETLTELTIEELPSSPTRSVQDMETGTYVRVYVYKQSDGSYVTDGILKAGSSSDFVAVEPDVAYHVKAVSYNSTTSGDVPGSVTTHMSAASVSGLSADKDVLYAETTIISGTAGSTIDIDLTFSHKFSLVRIVADNSASGDVLITACSAKLSHKYGASLALTDGTLTAGSDLGTHDFTWTSLNATAVTSDSATVYTGSMATGHVLSFTSITAGGSSYSNTSVTFNKAFEPGKKYRLTVKFKGAVP
ncbi:MAG: fimbrillin family protein, partial [Dysgonamonadaceae bacterium]|nr:fimbrillin family protein [Dysgonamonadaceae bacterium]